MTGVRSVPPATQSMVVASGSAGHDGFRLRSLWAAAGDIAWRQTSSHAHVREKLGVFARRACASRASEDRTNEPHQCARVRGQYFTLPCEYASDQARLLRRLGLALLLRCLQTLGRGFGSHVEIDVVEDLCRGMWAHDVPKSARVHTHRLNE